jgi:hypothetical protein
VGLCGGSADWDLFVFVTGKRDPGHTPARQIFLARPPLGSPDRAIDPPYKAEPADAKARGVYKGRKASIDPANIKQMTADGMGPSAIAKELKIGRASVYRALGDDTARHTRPPAS